MKRPLVFTIVSSMFTFSLDQCIIVKNEPGSVTEPDVYTVSKFFSTLSYVLELLDINAGLWTYCNYIVILSSFTKTSYISARNLDEFQASMLCFWWFHIAVPQPECFAKKSALSHKCLQCFAKRVSSSSSSNYLLDNPGQNIPQNCMSNCSDIAIDHIHYFKIFWGELSGPVHSLAPLGYNLIDLVFLYGRILKRAAHYKFLLESYVMSLVVINLGGLFTLYRAAIPRSMNHSFLLGVTSWIVVNPNYVIMSLFFRLWEAYRIHSWPELKSHVSRMNPALLSRLQTRTIECIAPGEGEGTGCQRAGGSFPISFPVPNSTEIVFYRGHTPPH